MGILLIMLTRIAQKNVTPVNCAVRLGMCCPPGKLNKYNFLALCRQLVLSLAIVDPILGEKMLQITDRPGHL